MTVLFANSSLLISGDLRVTRLKYSRNKVCYIPRTEVSFFFLNKRYINVENTFLNCYLLLLSGENVLCFSIQRV